MSDNLDLVNEYKDQIRILKQQLNEFEDSSKSKDAANKRCLQKMEYCQKDLEDTTEKFKALEEELKKIKMNSNEK